MEFLTRFVEMSVSCKTGRKQAGAEYWWISLVLIFFYLSCDSFLLILSDLITLFNFAKLMVLNKG